MDVTSLCQSELDFLRKKVRTIKSDSLWAQLPQACWQAAGGDEASGDLVTLAFLLGTQGVKLLDDVQDRHVAPECSNEGMALTFYVLQVLEALPALDLQQIVRLQRTYTATMLKMSAGQHLDLLANVNHEKVLEHSWSIAEQKTASWFAWGASLYAHYSGNEASAQILAKFGTHLGLMHQLANDFRGFFDALDTGDLKARKVSIPVAYLFTVIAESPFADEFKNLWQHAEADQSARERIVEIGRYSRVARYVQVMSVYHAQRAHQIVQQQFPDLSVLVNHPNLTISTTSTA